MSEVEQIQILPNQAELNPYHLGYEFKDYDKYPAYDDSKQRTGYGNYHNQYTGNDRQCLSLSAVLYK